MEIRIQKILSELGIASRRNAELIIKEGRVKKNGRPVNIGDKIDTKTDILSIDGKRVSIPKKHEFFYYMLNKPRGYITTMQDEKGRKSVKELVEHLPIKVYPVGRLDKESEGMLLFTNDGEFTNMLTHPSHGVGKLYRVTVNPHATEKQIINLTDGVELDDGTKTAPSVVRIVTDEPQRTVLEITIKQGLNRQIRRMCEALGLDVIRLARKAVGPVKLGMLKPGAVRELKPSEVIALKGSALKGKNQNISKENEEKPKKPKFYGKNTKKTNIIAKKK